MAHGFDEKKEQLSREDMEAVIAAGGSVSYGGNIITKVENLPTKAQLTAGTDDAPATAEELRKKKAAIDRELALLETAEKNKVNAAKADDAKSDSNRK